MMSVSITSMPSILTGKSPMVSGSVCSSLKHGICMISFIGGFELFIATLFCEPHVKRIFHAKLYFANIGVD
jgi:hypothetical protein